MKFLVVLSLALACVAADVSHLDSQAAVLKASYDISPEGAYQSEYETSNGIAAQEQGVLKKASGAENAYLEVTGAFKYNAPDNTPVQLTYVANEYGFQPQGSHLPVGPEIPEAIARALAYIAAHPPPVEKEYSPSLSRVQG